ncbi:MAG TPA: hypothetical protein VK044_06585 [Virgibacillus sp.]|nr:hypothetical protein [Virgibacillus sp.]
MKANHVYLTIMAAILFLNIIFAKYIVHQFYYQNYVNTLIFVGLNIILFPIALYVYKKSKKSDDVKKDDK